MANVINLPQLGQTMEEGTIVSCNVAVGDKINKGDVVFEVETDKATLEMESPEGGFVKAIIAEAGQTILVGEALLILGEENEEVDVAALTGSADAGASEPAAAPAASGASLPSDAIVVNLPQLGQTMEEGTIVSCNVAVGDNVNKGDVIFEVETDKATLEMESPESGTVGAILAEAGQTILVNEPVIIFSAEAISEDMIASVKGGVSEEAPAAVEPEPVVETPAPAAAPAPVAPVAKAAPANTGGRIFASPRAKMTALKMGVSLAGINGSGPNGVIVEADVLSQGVSAGKAGVAKTLPVMPAPEYNLGETVKISKIQKITGDKMLQSKQQLPCFYLNTTADVTDLVEHRAFVNQSGGVKVAFNDFIIRAMGMALKQFPIMAGQVVGDGIKIADEINIGLAIAVGSDLVAPIVKNVDQKNASQVAADSKALIAKAREGKLGPNDLSGGCCTLSNLGGFGIESFIPIVVPGQCSILGVGKIKDVVVPSNGNLLVRKTMALTLSIDHKVANGAYAAQCLDYMKTLLENPSML